MGYMDDEKSTTHATGKTSKVSAGRSSPPDDPASTSSGRPASSAPGTLTSRIRKLAVQERDAIRCRDWITARSVAEERTALQKARQVDAARRLA